MAVRPSPGATSPAGAPADRPRRRPRRRGVAGDGLERAHRPAQRRPGDPLARYRHGGRALGYHPDRVASSLRSAARTVVGAVVPELTNPFFAGLIERLEGEARAAGKRLLITASGGDPEEEAREVAALVAWRPAGVIVVPCDGRFAARRPARARWRAVRDRRPAAERGCRGRHGGRRQSRGRGRWGPRASSRRGTATCWSSPPRSSIGNMRERLAGISDALAGCDGAAAEVIEAGFAAGCDRRRDHRGPGPHARAPPPSSRSTTC